MMETPYAMYDALSAIAVPPEKVRMVVKSMEHDMALFATSSDFGRLEHNSGSRFDLLHTEIGGLRSEMDRRFDQMHSEIALLRDSIGDRLELVDGRFKQIKHELVAQLGAIVGGAVMLLGGLMVLLKG